MNRKTQPPDQTAPLPDSGAGGDVLPILLRFRDQHRWSWNLSTRLINLYCGTHYTEKQLRSMYKDHTQKN